MEKLICSCRLSTTSLANQEVDRGALIVSRLIAGPTSAFDFGLSENATKTFLSIFNDLPSEMQLLSNNPNFQMLNIQKTHLNRVFDYAPNNISKLNRVLVVQQSTSPSKDI
ncbi:hypothetical protein ACFE04_012934 [Oxalis oulophora]